MRPIATRQPALFVQAACVSLVLLTSSATARTYEGREAAALRCANTLALSAVALNTAGRIADDTKNAILGVTVRILDKHVQGSWAQKKAAMAIMRDRRSVPDTLKDYQRIAAKCLRQFPIN